MRLRRLLTFCLCVFSLVLGVGVAGATSYYVDSVGGSDSNSGTAPDQAWKTIGKVNTVNFAPGDNCYFKCGSDFTGTTTLVIGDDDDGTEASPITFATYGTGAKPKFRNSSTGEWTNAIEMTNCIWVVLDGIYAYSTRYAGVRLSNADHCTVKNCEVYDTGMGIELTNSEYCLITQNYCHDMGPVVNTPGGDDDYGGVGIWLYSGENEVSYNTVKDCRYDSYDYNWDGGCVEYYSMGTLDNCYIHHNWGEGCEGFWEVGGVDDSTCYNHTFAYNVTSDYGYLTCMHLSGTFGLDCDNIKVEHNTVVRTSVQWNVVGFDGAPDANTYKLKNNIFHVTGCGGDSIFDGYSGFTHDYNCFYAYGGTTVGISLNSHEVASDPQFVDFNNQDYHLQSTSPCRNAGTTLGYTVDFDGNTVPSGSAPDMGAYEYQEGPSAPVANFSGSPTSGTVPLTVSFTDTSSGNPTSWSWTFGDGGSSTSQNPSHQYTTADHYTVSLTATNAQGYDTETKTDYISVKPSGTPDQIFYDGFESALNWTTSDNVTWYTGSPKIGSYSVQLKKVGAIEKTISTEGYEWISVSFYMGANSLDNANENMQALWSSNGSDWTVIAQISDGEEDNQLHIFEVDLPASADDNEDFALRFKLNGSGTGDYGYVDDVTVEGFSTGPPSPPVANFTGNPTSGYIPLTVSFTDTSTNNPTSWSWTFGDGGTSTSQSPSHQYTTANTYTVSLQATNAGGSDTETKTNYITANALPNPPVADFSGSPTSGSIPLTVSFTDSSTNNPTSWSWTFGDGGSSTSQNPSHQYTTADTYTVSLTATNAQGYDTETKTDYITATSGPSQVTLYPDDFVVQTEWKNVTIVSGSLDDVDADDNVYFVTRGDSSSNSYGANYVWDTGYTRSQVTKIKIEFTMKSNRSASPAVNAYLRAQDGTSPSGDYLFVNWVTWGTSEQTKSYETTNVNKYISSSGEIGMLLCGCSQDSNNFDLSMDECKVTLDLEGGVSAPVADFSGSPTSGTAPLTVNFIDSSTNSPTSWSWTFGDGGTSTSQNPSHQYTSANTCTVSLQATNAGGSDTETKTDYITVNPAAPVADFSGSPTSGYVPLTVNFNDSSTNSPTSWSWTFGDGGSSTSQNPSHQYTSADTYTVSLQATNAGGSDTETKTDYITANALPNPPVADFSGSPTSGTAPLTVNFTDSSTNSPTSWSWTFGDGGTSTSQNPSHQYTSADDYTVSLQATNAGGSDTETKTDYITVNPPAPVADFSGSPTSGSVPLTVSFTDASTHSPTSWSWTFGDGGSSTSQNPSHQYTTANTYTVSLTATNAQGYDTETKTDYITATSGPTEVTLYPDDFVVQTEWKNVTIVSGSLDDVDADDNVYFVTRGDSSSNSYGADYVWDTGYTPAQVSKITIEFRMKSNRSASPAVNAYLRAQDGTSPSGDALFVNWVTWGTSEQTKSYETTNVSKYMSSTGEVGMLLCGCSQDSSNFDLSMDLCKVTLTLN